MKLFQVFYIMPFFCVSELLVACCSTTVRLFDDVNGVLLQSDSFSHINKIGLSPIVYHFLELINLRGLSVEF